MMWLNAWLSGAIFMAAVVIAAFFFRFWHQTGDKLFLYFALAFVLEGVHRQLQATPSDHPDVPEFYLLRLVEYGLIIMAIVQKNRAGHDDGKN